MDRYKTLIISVLCLLLSISAMAERAHYIDLNAFLKPDADLYNDIGYLQVVPQYTENPDPNKAITIEFFFGEYDGSEASIEKLKQIRKLIEDDKILFPQTRTDIIAVSPDTDTLANSRDLDGFLEALDFEDKKVHFQQVPEFLNYSAKINKKDDRHPSSLIDGRKLWTLVRTSSTMAGTFSALYFLEGLSVPLATSVAIWPGLASGAITYYSNAYGAFLTNEKWSTWLLESDNFFAKKVRTAFKLTPKNFQAALVKNKDYFAQKYPILYRNNPSLFEAPASQAARRAVQASQNKFTKILSRLKHAEEYFKWWVTEVAFTATAIKLPQAIAGIGEAASLTSMAGDVLMGSTMGMLAQGPGDIAIQIRKYQKVQELEQAVKAGTMQVDNADELLSEIKKVLDKTGKFKSYTINEGSHYALRKIENWSRSRATMLSFFAVTGVGLEIAGVPLARPLLISVGIGGMAYYSSVQGWLSPKKIMNSAKEYIRRFRQGEVNLSLSFLRNRYCGIPFRYKN